MFFNTTLPCARRTFSQANWLPSPRIGGGGYFRRNRTLCILCVAGMLLTLRAWAQAASSNPTVKIGKYLVELRVPADGLFAEDEADVEFHVSDISQDDPVQGAPPVVKAKVAARVTMPAMPAMPAQEPKTHSEGVPGDYGVVLYFPHGGDYQLELTITPPEDKPFTAAFKVSVSDVVTGRNRKPKPKPYTLEVQTHPSPPHAGEPTEFTLHILSRDTGQPVTEFDTVHERKIHFVIVTKDLGFFTHEHPDLAPDGAFKLRFTFPAGGDYHVFADVAPHGAGSQILMQPLTVVGPPVPTASALRPAATTEPVGGVSAALKTETAPLVAGRMIPLTFSLRDAKTGAAITDLEPYLGAMAHLILIHQDGETFVHCHPDETDPQNGHNGSLVILARFPKPGLYKGWLQIQRAGAVLTIPFVVTAKPQGGKA